MAIDLPEQLNLASFFLDHNLDAGRGAKACIRFEGRSITYAELARDTHRAAHALAALGLEQEQRVLLALPDVPEFAVAWFATQRVGGVCCAVSPEAKAQELRAYLDYTRAKVVVASPAAAEALRAGGAGVEARVLVVGSAEWREALERSPEHFPTPATHRDDPAVWLFTSGSTGAPKAAVHRARDFAYNTLKVALPVLGYSERDVTVSIPRLAFGYALGANLLFPLRAGATVALFEERPTPEKVCEVVAREAPTLLVAIPSGLNALNHCAALRTEDFRRLRCVLSAGEALPEEVRAAWKARTGVEVLDGIGSAELFHTFITNRIGDVRPGSLGRVCDGYEARVCDDEGRELPDGEIGTLWVRGGSIAIEYWHDRDLSLRTFRGEWCVSQDRFTRDAEGYFRFCGRGDDVFKVGGRWLSPLEVENCLLAHPAVKECAVVAFRDADGLEKPRAHVVPRSGRGDDALAQQLKEHVRQQLAPYKYPRDVRFTDALPRSERGKVLRNTLRD